MKYSYFGFSSRSIWRSTLNTIGLLKDIALEYFDVRFSNGDSAFRFSKILAVTR